MAKKRIKNTDDLYRILTFAQADNHIKAIGELQRQIDALNARADKRLNKIKETTKAQAGGIADKMRKHVDSLEAFCAANREDFAGQQSRKMVFGVLGWRKSTSIKVSTKTTIQKIKEVFGEVCNQYLRISEEADKDALRKLTDEQLKQIDAKRQNKEVFFVDPDLTEIEKKIVNA